MHRPALERVIEIFAVPFTKAAPALSSARAWPIAVHLPELSQPASAAAT